MRYVISDIHGCYDAYRQLLDKIGFSENDELYVLGDAMDRGPEPIRVIRDLMRRPNVFYVMGNHDSMFLSVMQKLAVDVTEENLSALTGEVLTAYQKWLLDGGAVTARQFAALSREERADILDYLACAAPYEMIEQDGKLYILVHAGIRNFSPEKEMDDYELTDLLWERPQYDQQYFPGGRIFLVTGHTPTMLIRQDQQPLVYAENGHIALDCGCVFGGRLAAYCVETGQCFYMGAGTGFSAQSMV